MRSGILTAKHPKTTAEHLFAALEKQHIVASLRSSRDGTRWLRFSPHFYNSSSEIQTVARVLEEALT
jgi:selenocysteine lyase/cysteine desulfurase